jgi:hypothetical protein
VHLGEFVKEHWGRWFMSEETNFPPKHSTTKTVLRVLGPLIAFIGLMLIVLGVGNLLSTAGTPEPPRYFWLVFVGMPVLFVGIVLCMLGFFGSFTGYVLGEAAPVQKDAFNYFATGTTEGVRAMAGALGEGLAGGLSAGPRPTVRCPRCNEANDADARFCKHCATPLVAQA